MKKHPAAIAMFVVLLISYILNSIDRNLFSILTVEVRKQMSLSLPEVGLAATVFTLGMGVAALPTGKLLTSVSRKSIVLLGLFIFSVATWLTAYSRGLPDLLAYRFISGLGEAMQVTALIAIGASYFHTRPALVTGMISFAYGIGAVVGPMIAAVLLKAYDWKMPFIVCGAVGIIMMLMIAMWIRPWFSESKINEEHTRSDRDNHAAPGSNDTTWSLATILLGLASVCTGVAVFGFFGLYPLYLRSVIEFSPAQAGLVMSAIGIGGFLSPFGGWLGDRVGSHKVLFVALPLTALSGGIPFTGLLGQSVTLYVAFAFIYGFAVVGMIYANMSAIIINSMSPTKTSLASGLFITSYYIPAAFAGYLMGRLKEASSWTTAGILQSSGFAAVALILIIVARTTRKPAMLPSGATL